MGFVSWIVWGFFVGLIARALLPGRQAIGCLWTIVLGIIGSILGGLLATEVLDIGDRDEFDFGSFALAVVTSLVLLAIYERVARRGADERGDRRGPPAAGRRPE